MLTTATSMNLIQASKIAVQFPRIFKKTKSRPITNKDSDQWIRISLDILEQNFLVVIIQPFITAFGLFFLISLLTVGLLAFALFYLYNNNFELLINPLLIVGGYVAIISISALVFSLIHTNLTVERTHILHSILPYLKTKPSTYSTISFFVSTLSFFIALICGYFVILNTVSSTLIPVVFFGLCIGLILVYRLFFKYIIYFVMFENKPYFEALKYSLQYSFNSGAKSILHTLSPIIGILGLGLASVYLIQITYLTQLNPVFIMNIYLGVYYLYYYLFGFTTDYLAFVYLQLRQTAPSDQPKQQLSSNKITFGIGILLSLCIPIIVWSGLTLSTTNVISQTQNSFILTKQMSERPISSSTIYSEQPFEIGETISYRNIEFSVTSLHNFELDDESIKQICSLTILIKNNDTKPYQFIPYLSLSMFDASNDKLLSHLFSRIETINQGDLIDPSNKYIIHKNLPFRGTLHFDCTEYNKQYDIKIQYSMIRPHIATKDTFLTIDSYLEFEEVKANPAYRHSTITLEIPPQKIKAGTVSSTIPLALTVDSLTTYTLGETRFCKVSYTLANEWNKPVLIEFYMTELFDSSGNKRQPFFSDPDFNPEESRTTVLPNSVRPFTRDFNCQDGGTNYNLKFTPFVDFGEFVKDQSLITQAII